LSNSANCSAERETKDSRTWSGIPPIHRSGRGSLPSRITSNTRISSKEPVVSSAEDSEPIDASREEYETFAERREPDDDAVALPPSRSFHRRMTDQERTTRRPTLLVLAVVGTVCLIGLLVGLLVVELGRGSASASGEEGVRE